jgi:hypothetical protein
MKLKIKLGQTKSSLTARERRRRDGRRMDTRRKGAKGSERERKGAKGSEREYEKAREAFSIILRPLKSVSLMTHATWSQCCDRKAWHTWPRHQLQLFGEEANWINSRPVAEQGVGQIKLRTQDVTSKAVPTASRSRVGAVSGRHIVDCAKVD